MYRSLLIFSFIYLFIYSCSHSFIHSCLTYDRSIVSSKARSPRSVRQCFIFQFSISSLFLKVIQQLLTSSPSSFNQFHSSLYLSLNKILQKVVTTCYVTNAVSFLFLLYLRYSFPPLLCNFIPTDLLLPSEVPNFKTFQLFLIYFPKCPIFSTIHVLNYTRNVTLYWFLP